MSGVNGLLWVLAIVLAIILLVVGFVLVRDDPAGKKKLGWPDNSFRGVTVTFGIVMVLGAIGLVVPPLIPGLAWLTPLAAGLLAALMMAIAQSYLIKRDSEGAAPYILLMLMLAALAFGRWPALATFLG